MPCTESSHSLSLICPDLNLLSHKCMCQLHAWNETCSSTTLASCSYANLKGWKVLAGGSDAEHRWIVTRMNDTDRECEMKEAICVVSENTSCTPFFVHVTDSLNILKGNMNRSQSAVHHLCLQANAWIERDALKLPLWKGTERETESTRLNELGHHNT